MGDAERGPIGKRKAVWNAEISSGRNYALCHRRYVRLGVNPGLANIVGMGITELEGLLSSLGEPRYRARQIMDWVYGKGFYSFEEMSNLPKLLRDKLAQHACIALPAIIRVQVAPDGTRKYLLGLMDGQRVEAVAISEGERLTACLSSQVGCAIGCVFCATGLSGLVRNMSVAEIVGQLLALQEHLGLRVTNVVMMGMGEPLANYDNVMAALGLMNHPQTLGIGVRRFTLSTSGVVPGILRLAAEHPQVNLAVSLHAANDYLRNQLVPINRKYPIDALIKACREYVSRTGRRVTFEYVLLRGINDAAEHAHELGRLLQDLLCHVNLIPVNPVRDTHYKRPEKKVTASFARIVKAYDIRVTVRKEKGTGIDAACGQLRLSEVKAF